MEAQDRTKVWFIVALCLLLLIGGYFFAEWLIGPREPFRGAAPEQPPVPLIAPVAHPPLKKYEDIAQYTDGKPLPTEPSPFLFLTEVESDEHIRGDRGTTVTVMEYAALSSLYTQVFHRQMQKLFEANSDRIHWVFRHYPSYNNENDYRSGIATECIAEQLGNDGFWKYLDLLMSTPGSTLPLDLLLTRGREVGADDALLQACIEERGVHYDRMIDDKRYAQTDTEIYVAPSFVFLNNQTQSMRIVEGINTIEYMQAVLDDVSR